MLKLHDNHLLLMKRSFVNFVLDRMHLFYLRVDPSAPLENMLSKEATIWEIALLCYWESPELLNTLSVFKEIPEQVKLLKLSKMIWLREEERLGGKDNLEQLKEEFLKTLQSLSSLETVKKNLPSLDLFFISR